jgi:hypothetical protein
MVASSVKDTPGTTTKDYESMKVSVWNYSDRPIYNPTLRLPQEWPDIVKPMLWLENGRMPDSFVIMPNQQAVWEEKVPDNTIDQWQLIFRDANGITWMHDMQLPRNLKKWKYYPLTVRNAWPRFMSWGRNKMIN